MSLSLEEKINMLPSLRATVEAHGLLAKKALGQNFLLDRNITGKIIRLSLNAQNLSDYRGAAVYEVGPGPGGLTREILRAEPDKLTVVEMDERCIAIMEEIKTKVGERLQIVNGDALKQNFAELNQTPCHIVSNLPYNISVPLLVGWLKEIENFTEKLDKENRKEFQNILDTYLELTYLEKRQSFCDGFRIGAGIMCEVFKERSCGVN